MPGLPVHLDPTKPPQFSRMLRKPARGTLNTRDAYLDGHKSVWLMAFSWSKDTPLHERRTNLSAQYVWGWQKSACAGYAAKPGVV
jgi:hypothetical protein